MNSDKDRVTAWMPGYVADFVADALDAFLRQHPRRGYDPLAQMFRDGGADGEVTIMRQAYIW